MTEKILSPFTEFKIWLFSPNDEKLSETVINAVNARSILAMFSKHKDVTIFLDEVFNNYNLMKIPKEEFFYFLKDMVHKSKLITKYNLCYFKTERKDEEVIEIVNKFPFIKKREVELMTNKLEQTDIYEPFLDYIGLNKIKRVKLTKEEKMEMKELTKETIKEEEPVIEIVAEIKKEIETWEEFKNQFKIGG